MEVLEVMVKVIHMAENHQRIHLEEWVAAEVTIPLAAPEEAAMVATRPQQNMPTNCYLSVVLITTTIIMTIIMNNTLVAAINLLLLQAAEGK